MITKEFEDSKNEYLSLQINIFNKNGKVKSFYFYFLKEYLTTLEKFKLNILETISTYVVLSIYRKLSSFSKSFKDLNQKFHYYTSNGSNEKLIYTNNEVNITLFSLSDNGVLIDIKHSVEKKSLVHINEESTLKEICMTSLFFLSNEDKNKQLKPSLNKMSLFVLSHLPKTSPKDVQLKFFNGISKYNFSNDLLYFQLSEPTKIILIDVSEKTFSKSKPSRVKIVACQLIKKLQRVFYWSR